MKFVDRYERIGKTITTLKINNPNMPKTFVN